MLPKLTWKEIENLNRSIIYNKKWVVKLCPLTAYRKEKKKPTNNGITAEIESTKKILYQLKQQDHNHHLGQLFISPNITKIANTECFIYRIILKYFIDSHLCNPHKVLCSGWYYPPHFAQEEREAQRSYVINMSESHS